MTLQRSTALAVTLLATAPGALRAAEEGGSGPFSVNPGLTIWTTVIFLVLLGILWKYAWGPILGAVEAREEGIRSDLDEAAREREEAARLLAEHKEQLADSRRQAQQILAEAREAADELRKELESKARDESEAILVRAREEIEREKERALDSLRKESVELALAAASKLIQRRLDADEDRRIVQELISGMDGLSSSDSGAAQA